MIGWASVDHDAKHLCELPSVTTSNALWFVHAKTSTTLWALPLGIFLGNMPLHSDGFDAHKICNDAHLIFCLVPIIEMKQIGARILCTRKAEPVASSRKLSTVFDGTSEAGI